MESYVSYTQNLFAQGLSKQAVIDNLRRYQLDDGTIAQVILSAATTAAPPAEAYVDYVKMQASRGMASHQIAADLRTRGLNQQAVDSLLQVATQAQPASYPQGMQQYGVTEPHVISSTTAAAANVETSPQRKVSPLIVWLTVALSCLMPSLIILFDAPGRFANGTQTLLTIGDVTGVIGLCLFVFNLVMAMRLSWLEDIFGGLNRVYVAHAILGSTALMFILVHPVLLSLRFLPYGLRSVGQFFIPSLHYIGTAYGIFATLCILGLTFLALYIHLPYRLWLKTHKYLSGAYILICLHVLFTPNSITQNIVVHGYLLLLLTIGLIAFVYRTLLPNIFVRRYIYLIKAVTMKTTGVVEITMTSTQKTMPYTAGQFVFISFHADGLSPEWHPFTISSPPSDGTLGVTVKSLGAYTETICRLVPNMVGMTVLIEGAYGRFSFRNFKNLNQVWIAGGIGITPFLSMAQSLGDGPYDIDLYYSVKSETELIDIEVLAKMQSNVPGRVFRVFPFVADKYGRRLSAELIASNSGDLHGKDFLVCGPPPMMQDVEKQLCDMGVQKYQIHSEEFSIV